MPRRNPQDARSSRLNHDVLALAILIAFHDVRVLDRLLITRDLLVLDPLSALAAQLMKVNLTLRLSRRKEFDTETTPERFESDSDQ